MKTLKDISRRMRDLKDPQSAGGALDLPDIRESRLMRLSDRLPGGDEASELSADELAKLLQRLGVTGASASNTVLANRCCLAVLIAAIEDEGATDAVTWWRIRSEDTSDERENRDDEEK